VVDVDAHELRALISSDTRAHGLPIFVFVTRMVSSAIETTDTKMVTSVVRLTDKPRA
jgi:hypothetical protein